MCKPPGSQKSPGQVLEAYSSIACDERGEEAVLTRSQPNPNLGKWELAIDPI